MGEEVEFGSIYSSKRSGTSGWRHAPTVCSSAASAPQGIGYPLSHCPRYTHGNFNHDRWAEEEAAQSTRPQHPVPLHQGNPMTSYKAAVSFGNTCQPLWKHLQGRNLCNLAVTERTLKLTDFVAHHQLLVMNLREPRHSAVKRWKEDIHRAESRSAGAQRS